MALRNEIMDAVAVYKTMTPTSQDRYYDLLAQEARRKSKLEQVGDDAFARAYKLARSGKRGQPTTAAPQVVPPPPTGMAFNPAPPVQPTIDEEIAEWSGYRRGGKVKRFDNGGQVTAEDEQAEADMILRSVMQRDQNMGPLPPRNATPAEIAEQKAGRRPMAESPNFGPAPPRDATDLDVIKEKVRRNTEWMRTPDATPPSSMVPRFDAQGLPISPGEPAAVIPGRPSNGPGTPPEPAAAVAVAGDPSVYGKVPGANITGGEPEVALRPTAYPTRTVAGAGGGARPVTPGVTAPGTGAGTTGPGSGNGSVPAPPPGASRVEDPRTRVAAFDPGRERINPDQTTAARQLDASGQVVVPSPQEIAQMVSTAAQGRGGANGAAPPIGNGAASRPVVQELVSQYNQGGQLTEGQALMAGMHAKYRVLLAQGRVKDAAQMAWGLIQAANLEAASLGMVARDQINSGNFRAGLQTIAKAGDWAPDGMKHVANGNGIDTYDNNGRLVNRMPVSPKQALEIALGLSDGSMMWQTLQSAASLLNPPDKGAEGRQLTNDYRRLQIEDLRRRMANRGKGGGGESPQARDLRTYLATGNIAPPSRGGGSGESDNTHTFPEPREEADG